MGAKALLFALAGAADLFGSNAHGKHSSLPD
jgi:hypothetical protein